MSRHRTAASPAFGLRLTRTLLAIQAVPVAFFFALRLASLDASSTRHTFGWRAIAGISSGAHFGGTARTGACLAIGCRSYPCRRLAVLDLENGVCRVWRLPTVDSFPTFFSLQATCSSWLDSSWPLVCSKLPLFRSKVSEVSPRESPSLRTVKSLEVLLSPLPSLPASPQVFKLATVATHFPGLGETDGARTVTLFPINPFVHHGLATRRRQSEKAKISF